MCVCCSFLERSCVLSHGSGMYCLSLPSFLHTRDLSGGCGSPEILSPGHRCKGPATRLPSYSSSRVRRHRFEHPHSKWPLLPRSSPRPGASVCVSGAGHLCASPERQRSRGSGTERQGEGDKEQESRSQTHRRVRGQQTPERKRGEMALTEKKNRK